MPTSGDKYYFVSSLAKGLRIIELLAANGAMSVSQTANLLKTSRAAIHRFLTTLRDLGYVEKTETGSYGLTFKVLELGIKKLEGFEIRHVAQPFMKEIAIAFNETVNLGFWDGNAIVHIGKIDSTEILRMDLGIGAVAPAYCSGLGKAILAHLPKEELNAYLLRVDFKQLTPKTIISVLELKSELEKIRQNGFSVDNEELSLGLRCVAAPVFDYNGSPKFALSISGPAQRIPQDRIGLIADKVRDVSRRLTEKIGGTRFISYAAV